VNLVICDDETLFVDALAMALEARGCRVVARTTHPTAALRAVCEHHVNVCLLDVHFRGVDSIGVVRDLVAASPETKVVMLSGDDRRSVITEAIRAGAAGYIPKYESTDLIVRTLRRVHAGEVVAPPAPSRQSVTTNAREQHLIMSLTPREREVLVRLVNGESSERIASELGIRRSTARTHIQNVLSRLGVHSMMEAAALAVRHELVPRPSSTPRG
jgi:two-component system nitrate/nitrite response regulator NarL